MQNIQTIDDLKTAIQGIIVKDYGDFKRKTITYMNRYLENHTLGKEAQKKVHFMRWYIQFHPNLDLINTKLWTLQQLEEFRTIQEKSA